MTHRRAPGHGPELPIVPIKWPPRVLATAVLLAILGALTMASAGEIQSQTSAGCDPGFHRHAINRECVPDGIQDGPDPVGGRLREPLRPYVTDDSEPFAISTITIENEDGSVSVVEQYESPLGACTDDFDCRQWVIDTCKMNRRGAKSFSRGSDGKGGMQCTGTCKGGDVTVTHSCPLRKALFQTAIPIEE
jgi:hypothetical protein